MANSISIIIPNYNGSRTIGKCLESVFASADSNREVIVVDDCSGDRSVEAVKAYPCTLIKLEKRSGASAARNAGAFSSKGEILFFIDADCLIAENTLAIIRKNFPARTQDVAVGGTYQPIPYDPGFFSLFQSVFINYFETKNSRNPDYLATHSLAIPRETFRKTGGFREDLPMIEDVEFSHRLRQAGCTLLMDPDLQVTHIFNFSFLKSIKNAARKSRYWVLYSLSSNDLFTDSGTASKEIKITGIIWLSAALLAMFSVLSGLRELLIPVPLLFGVGILVNRSLIGAFHKTGGMRFAIQAAFYYLAVYPLLVWLGAMRGAIDYFSRSKARQASLKSSSGEKEQSKSILRQ